MAVIVFPEKWNKSSEKGDAVFTSRDDDCFPLLARLILAAEEEVKLALILQIDPSALGRWPAQNALSPSTHLFFSWGVLPLYLSVCHLAPIMFFFQVIAFLAVDNSCSKVNEQIVIVYEVIKSTLRSWWNWMQHMTRDKNKIWAGVTSSGCIMILSQGQQLIIHILRSQL